MYIIQNIALEWFKDYLTNRSQYMIHNIKQDRRWTPINPRPPQINKSQHDQSCRQTITSHFLSHIHMLSVHEAIKISYAYHLACLGSRNSQKSDVSNHSVVCWHGSVAFPILPIDIENLSRLSKCTLPIISIPKPLKLSNCQTRKYRILCPSRAHPWCLCEEWAIIRYGYVPMHFLTVMGHDMQ